MIAPPPRNNIIRGFALVCVAVTTIFVIGMSIWLTMLLSQPDWCQRAIGAAQKTEGVVRPEFAVSGCFALLNEQVNALAWNSHIALAVVALCLLVLIVIVVAGGHLSFKASKDGLSGDIGSTAGAAAQVVADAAQDKATEVVQAVDAEMPELKP